MLWEEGAACTGVAPSKLSGGQLQAHVLMPAEGRARLPRPVPYLLQEFRLAFAQIAATCAAMAATVRASMKAGQKGDSETVRGG